MNRNSFSNKGGFNIQVQQMDKNNNDDSFTKNMPSLSLTKNQNFRQHDENSFNEPTLNRNKNPLGQTNQLDSFLLNEQTNNFDNNFNNNNNFNKNNNFSNNINVGNLNNNNFNGNINNNINSFNNNLNNDFDTQSNFHNYNDNQNFSGIQNNVGINRNQNIQNYDDYDRQGSGSLNRNQNLQIQTNFNKQGNSPRSNQSNNINQLNLSKNNFGGNNNINNHNDFQNYTGGSFNQNLNRDNNMNMGMNSSGGESQTVTNFINILKSQLQKSMGLNFEGLLQKYNIPPTNYIDKDKLEELCIQLGLLYKDHEINEVISYFDQDRVFKLKTQALKDKLMQQQMNTRNNTISINNLSNLNNQNNINNMNSNLNIPQQQNRNLNKNRIQSSLDQIKTFIQQNNLNDLRQFFNISYVDDKEVVELQEFLAFLEFPGINLNKSQSYDVASKYLIKPAFGQQTTCYIDIMDFEIDIMPNITLVKNQSLSMKHLHNIYDTIRMYIIQSGGNIIKVFKDFDLNQDGVISKAEFKIALQKLGIQNLQEQELNGIFDIFDREKDGKISYQELCQQFAEFSNTKAIKDPSHWAFFIFESIRRKIQTSNIGLAQIFGINSTQNNNRKIMITSQQFFQALAKLQIPIKQQEQQLLLQLLNTDQRSNEIDFMYLQELVGMNYQNQQVGKYNSEYYKNPYESNVLEKSKKFYRQIYDVLYSKGIHNNINYLRMLIKQSDFKNTGYININEFIQKFQQLDSERRIDFTLLKDVGKAFITQQGPQQVVDYNYFFGLIQYETEKYNFINYIFLTFDAEMQNQGITNLQQLFFKVAQSQGQQTKIFNKDMLQQTLTLLHIEYSQDFIDMILIEYDPKGTGVALDFETFNKDFEEFREGRSLLNSYQKVKNQNYQDFFTQTKEYMDDDFQFQERLQNYTSNSSKKMLGAYKQNNLQSNNQQQAQNIVRPNTNTGTGTMRQINQQKQPNYQITPILKKIAMQLDQNQRINLGRLMIEHDITRSGVVSLNDLYNILGFISVDECRLLQGFYTDNLHQNQIIAHEFLNDLNEHIFDANVKIGLTSAQLELQDTFNKNSTNSRIGTSLIQNSQNLKRFQTQFEDIFKAIKVRKSDTFSWFEQFSPNKHSLQLQQLQDSIFRLQVQSVSQHDVSEIFDALDNQRTGNIDIQKIDEAIRNYTSGSGQKLVDDIIEKIMQGYNGDDSYVLNQMYLLDSSKRGQISELMFVQFFTKNPPQFYVFAETDMHFLAQNYINAKMMTQEVDYNRFHNDMLRVKKERNIYSGTYNELNQNSNTSSNINNRNQQFNRPGSSQNNINQQNMIQRTNNPMLTQFSKNNTKSEQLRIQPPLRFRLNLQSQYIEDLMKATYIQGELIQDFFYKYVQPINNNQIIQQNNFEVAINDLGLQWNRQEITKVFQEIDRAFSDNLKLVITPEQIDQAVAFSTQKTIEDLHKELLIQIQKEANQKNISLRGEFQALDMTYQKSISVEQMKQILLNRLQMRQMIQSDVTFLCQKYIMNFSNQVQYEKLIEDIDSINRGLGGMGKTNNFEHQQKICDYIKKACIVNKTSIEEVIKKQLGNTDTMVFDIFQKIFITLNMVPDILTNQEIQSFFKEIDLSGYNKITPAQFINFIQKHQSSKLTRDFQDDTLVQIVQLVQSQNIFLENIFKGDDAMGKGQIPEQAFIQTLKTNFKLKQIDTKLLALRYLDSRSSQINYKQFFQDCQQQKSQLLSHSNTNFQNNNNNNNMLQGNNNNMFNKEIDPKLKGILIKIGQYLQQRGLQISTQLIQHEKGQNNGTIPKSSFLQVITNCNLPLQPEEKSLLTVSYERPNQQTDHRSFLQDLKLYALSQRSLSQLTSEQQNIYKQLGDSLTQSRKHQLLANGLKEKDLNQKGFLSKMAIQDAFNKIQQNLTPLQFNTILSALDTNQQGDLNYKMMVELLFGTSQANQLLYNNQQQQQQVKKQQSQRFIMPQKPINAKNIYLEQIGKKVIQGGVNIEEEFKKIMSQNQQNDQQPRASEQDIINVLQKCKVVLSNDERIEMQTYVSVNKNQQGLVGIIEFLGAIGLPNQTIGQTQQLKLPKKILTQEELHQAQLMISSLRQELLKQKKTPKDVFEKLKKTVNDLSIPPLHFKLALETEFGSLGKTFTPDQLSLLVYYLVQEVDDEVSYKKLYLAFTLTDKEPPLKQQGATEIQQYEQRIKEQFKKGAIPLEIIDLSHYMKQAGLTMTNIFKQSQKGLIPRQQFEQALKEAGYVPRDMNALVELLLQPGSKLSVSLDKLVDFLRRGGSEGKKAMNPSMARDMYERFDTKVKQHLQKINDYLTRNNITLQKMYTEMDVNKDGSVDKMEFVNTLSQRQIPGIQPSDLGHIFDSIDINNDGQMSINEFGMFVEGAKVNRMQKMQEIDPKMVQDMKNEIQMLFKSFDENGDGYVTAEEIHKSMMALGQRITIQDAKDMIAQIDKDGDGRLNMNEFTELMLPKMKEELMLQDDNMEDLRAMFIEADIDHSGTLSIDEIYSVILKLGAEVTLNELIEMMNEIDVDRDGSLGIDEFMALMGMGDELQFKKVGSKNTFLSIRKARKLHPMDFFKHFKNMPMNFVPSFFTERWTKNKKNMPSSVFKPQLDPKTMLYKDLLPVLSENLPPTMQQKQLQPRIRPIMTQVGCQILLDHGEGIPLPQMDASFQRNQIVKRVVRIGLYDTVKKDFIINAVQVNAVYNQNDEDMWKFNEQKENGLNPVLFKTSNKDEYCKDNIVIIFELAIYVKIGEKVTEMSCGWCQLSTLILDRAMTHKLQVKGGSPNAEMIIKDQDVHTKRTGINYIMKVVTAKINSQLTVSIRPHTKFTDETKFHLDLLPSTCLIQKRLLYFVSGFRNYLGEKLLKESSMGSMKHPEGDVVISCFPKILDNPDICENLIKIWAEDFWSSINGKQKMNVEYVVLKTKDFIHRLYPVIYSEEFKYKESNPFESASGDQYLMRKREELISSALRYGQANSKVKVGQPLEQITNFKPFTVKELEFEVWETNKAKQDRYLRQYEEIGLVKNQSFGVDLGGQKQNYGGLGTNSQIGGMSNIQNQGISNSSNVRANTQMNSQINPISRTQQQQVQQQQMQQQQQQQQNPFQSSSIGVSAYQKPSLDSAFNRAFK